MMDHIMNVRLSLEFGQVYARIPLVTAPHIRHADALELDWSGVLPPVDCSYVFGNPPFIGFVMRGAHQQDQASGLMARLGASGSRLDYVCAWFLKAGEYVQSSSAKIAFVATNSITQGEQVAQVWPALFGRFQLEIAFAHRTFAWGSDARGQAHVHVVVVGLTKRDHEPTTKRLFSYSRFDDEPHESRHQALTAYLFDASPVNDRHLLIRRASRPLNGLPRLAVGSKPVDDGHYIFTAAERDAFLAREPASEPFMRPFIGGREYLYGLERWILHLRDVPPEKVRSLPKVMERIAAVRRYRTHEGGNLARKLASFPTRFHVTVVPTAPFLCIPEASSERREYVPIGWIDPPTMPSNQLYIVQDATPAMFGVLTSRMHVAWLANIGGRLKSDFRYSGGIVYNTFPWPQMSEAQSAKVEALANTVLAVRQKYPGATPADLYDPDAMPSPLRQAHQVLDTAVDKLYRSSAFTSDRDRVEHLFGLYERIVVPLIIQPRRRARMRRAS